MFVNIGASVCQCLLPSQFVAYDILTFLGDTLRKEPDQILFNETLVSLT